jgi:hypothetical protein
MRVLMVIVAALALAAPASAATAHGVMTNGGGPVHSGEQGAIWQSRFVEHRRGTLRYSACVIYLDARNVVRCKAGTTNRAGVDRLTFSVFVNLRPGHWVVRFFELGHKLSAWRFTVRAEGA